MAKKYGWALILAFVAVLMFLGKSHFHQGHFNLFLVETIGSARAFARSRSCFQKIGIAFQAIDIGFFPGEDSAGPGGRKVYEVRIAIESGV